MLDSISPYELLKASKPKGTPTITTAYDLYSAAQSVSPSIVVPAAVSTPPPPDVQEPAAPRIPATTVPTRRTHYIADIQSRHNLAQRRAAGRP